MIPLENLPAVRPDDELAEVVRQTHETETSQALVLEDGRLLGIVIHDAILHHAELRVEQEVAPESDNL
jgi:predicted transcriptional regulator